MCATEGGGGVPEREIPFTTLKEYMLDFFFSWTSLWEFSQTRKQKRFMNSNLTLFIIIIVILSNIVIQIIYFHICFSFFGLYYLNHNMDTVMPIINIFLAEALCLRRLLIVMM